MAKEIFLKNEYSENFISQCFKICSFKEKVSEVNDEGKMLKLRLRCARVEVDKVYRLTSGGS